MSGSRTSTPRSGFRVPPSSPSGLSSSHRVRFWGKGPSSSSARRGSEAPSPAKRQRPSGSMRSATSRAGHNAGRGAGFRAGRGGLGGVLGGPPDRGGGEGGGDAQPQTRQCVPRPEHPTQVARPELTIYGESVEDALRVLIEKLRGRRPADIFLPLE